MAHTSLDSFARARTEKRELFQNQWNQFIQSWLHYVLLALLLASQVLFLLSSVDFFRQQILFVTKLGENHPLWYEVAISLFLSLPGFGFLAGLWKLCRKSRWQEDTAVGISGFRLIKRTNLLICVFTGIVLLLYPTIIITSGEYLREPQLLRLFYLLMPFVALFLLCITLVRIVIKKAEENFLCCWADTGCLLPLILILASVAAVSLAFFPKTLFVISVAAMAGVYAVILICWWLFLRRTAICMAAIDHKVIVSRENPDDPYHRYR